MNKNIVIAALALTTILFAALYVAAPKSVPVGAANPSGQVHYQQEAFLQGAAFGARNQSYFDNAGKLAIGSSGTQLTQVIKGTCNPTQITPGSFPASTTAQFYCAVTGVLAGDLVIPLPPVGFGVNGSGSGSVGSGFEIFAAYATTTNQIGFTYANNTGAATTTFPQATTSVGYVIIR